METIFINDTAFIIGGVVADKIIMSEGASGEAYTVDGTMVDPTMQTGAATKDSLLTSWPFVIGISAAVLLVSVALGALLAKRKIKKGIDLYED